VAVVILFFFGRSESATKAEAIETAERSVNTQIQREVAGAVRPDERVLFLKKQKTILGAIRKPTPITIAPQASAPEPNSSPTEVPAQSSTLMPIVVTAVLGIFAIGLIVVGTQQDDARKWAFATLGTIVGYWLKG
jgi:hypothetical protein